MKKWISDVYYSFPLQLLILHLRNNLLILGCWILIGLLMTGTIGRLFGARFLFLAPEYLGEVNFISFFLLGLGFGAFFMTWNLTTYLLEAHHFPFLASLARPFTKFCLNNLIIPLVFLGFYFFYTIHFQWYYEYWNGWLIFYNIIGFTSGFAALVIFTSIYFHFTNKDIVSFKKLRKNQPPNLLRNITPGRDIAKLGTIQTGISTWRIDTYLTESFKPRLVRSVAHYDSSILLSVFKQNHVNTLLVQVFGLVVLVILGYLIDQPFFRIPAGTSVFILGSVIIAVTGAITYWFDKWRIPVIVLLLILINIITSYDLFNHTNKAYGLDYTGPLAEYSYECLENSCAVNQVEEDKATTINILDNWKVKCTQHENEKPKMVVLCVSGGGMKAAVWAMQVLQQADQALNGDLFKHIALITGASGGLIGSAYLRELNLKIQQGADINLYDEKYIDNISKDLLNSLIFTIVVNDLFLPWTKFEKGGFTYHKDRGYIFEQQLNQNTYNAFTRSIADYREPEATATIPMMFITPSIVNDGRRMIISPHKVSYMSTAPVSPEKRHTLEIDAVDFGRLFEKQGAYDMEISTALRMNATYPYILPNVYLPSVPGIEVMDAGFRDNYGIMSASRFIHVFKNWIKANTSGVILVQIAAQNKIEEINPSDQVGMIEALFSPLVIPSQLLALQDYETDTNLGFLFDLLGEDLFEIIRFVYHPTKDNEEASMTFHLTKREKHDIMKAYDLPANQQSFKRLKQSLQPLRNIK